MSFPEDMAHRWRDLLRWKRGSVIAIGLYLALGILLPLTVSDRFMFVTVRGGDWNARTKSRYPIEEHTFTLDDGAQCLGWYLLRPRAPFAILYLHGNQVNLTTRVGMMETFAEQGWPTLAIDYPGYGRSTGRPSEDTLNASTRAAFDFLQAQGYPPERIVVYGECLGGGPAVTLASEEPVRGLVLQSAFTRAGDVCRSWFPILPWHRFLQSPIDNVSRIDEVDCPILLIATKRDKTIPFRLTRALYEAAPEPKRWLEFEAADHANLFGLQQERIVQEMELLLAEPVGER